MGTFFIWGVAFGSEIVYMNVCNISLSLSLSRRAEKLSNFEGGTELYWPTGFMQKLRGEGGRERGRENRGTDCETAAFPFLY